MHVRLGDRSSRDRTHGADLNMKFGACVCNKSYRDNPGSALGVIKDELTLAWNKSRYLRPERLNPEHKSETQWACLAASGKVRAIIP